jgi:hypothetical protein
MMVPVAIPNCGTRSQLQRKMIRCDPRWRGGN